MYIRYYLNVITVSLLDFIIFQYKMSVKVLITFQDIAYAKCTLPNVEREFTHVILSYITI